MLTDEVFEQYKYLYKKKLKEGILSLEDDLGSLKIPGFRYALQAYCDAEEPQVCFKMVQTYDGYVDDYDTLYKMAEYFFIKSSDYFEMTLEDFKIRLDVMDKVFQEIDEFVDSLK